VSYTWHEGRPFRLGRIVVESLSKDPDIGGIWLVLLPVRVVHLELVAVEVGQ
jgi:hypothetical protein